MFVSSFFLMFPHVSSFFFSFPRFSFIFHHFMKIDPISGTADEVTRSQQKVQPASRMEMSRDSECDEPRVVRGSSEDKQGHSRRGA